MISEGYGVCDRIWGWFVVPRFADFHEFFR
jgi:hypothetical protein